LSISKNQRILVTGGTGVLGAYVVKHLLQTGYSNIEIFTRSGDAKILGLGEDKRVKFTKGDVTELFPLTDSIKEADFVIHAAAIVSFDPRDFKIMHAVNVEGTANVMNLSSTLNVKKVIHVSSIAALGRSEKSDLISEKSVWTNSKFNSYYGITKYLSEQEVWRSFYEGQAMAIVNPSLILGDGDWNQSSLQIFEKTYDGLPFYPTGSTGLVDVRDVAEFIVSLMESSVEGERYILSAGNLSYQDIFEKMAKSMNRKPPSKPAPKWMLSIFWRIEKLRCLLTKKQPIITKESVRSTAHQSKYDNRKSLSMNGFEYRTLDETLDKFSKAYAEFRKNRDIHR
jgi:nucleoside-diphosphate-sugar epimerase